MISNNQNSVWLLNLQITLKLPKYVHRKQSHCFVADAPLNPQKQTDRQANAQTSKQVHKQMCTDGWTRNQHYCEMHQ